MFLSLKKIAADNLLFNIFYFFTHLDLVFQTETGSQVSLTKNNNLNDKSEDCNKKYRNYVST